VSLKKLCAIWPQGVTAPPCGADAFGAPPSYTKGSHAAAPGPSPPSCIWVVSTLRT
jgi:hypothetical protein